MEKDGVELYEVERVIDHRYKKGLKTNKIELEIKWVGYEETTWENFKEFAQDSPDLLHDYWMKQDKSLRNFQNLAKDQDVILKKMEVHLRELKKRDKERTKRE